MIPQALRDQWTRSTVAYYWDGQQFSKVQAGEPREPIDPVTGDRYILAEPQRTNYTENSSDLSQWGPRGPAVLGSSKTSVIKGETAYIAKSDGSAPSHGDFDESAGTTITGTQTASFLVEEHTSSTCTFGAKGTTSSASDEVTAEFDFVNESLSNHSQSYGTIQSKDYRKLGTGPNGGDLYLLIVRIAFDTGGNTRRARFNGDVNGTGDGTILHHAQIEEALFPTSPIVTGSSTVTRSNDEVPSLTAPLASGAKSVYFRIEQEAAGYDPNEGGNITNAAINLTTSGNEGSAGNGLLRPSTGVMGVSADGIIDEVINTSDSDLQGNSTTSAVDTFVIKPHKDTTSGGAIYRIYNLDVWEDERTQSEKESLRNNRPQPWLELDGETISALNSDPLWDNNGLNPPPYQWDITKYNKIPAKIRSAWNRSSSARRFDGSTFVSEGTDVARLDYGPDLNPNGLFVEAAGRTNYVRYSVDASQFNGATNCTVGGTPTSIVKGGTARILTANSNNDRYAKGTFSGADVTSTQAAKFLVEEGSSVKTRLLIYDRTNNNIPASTSIDWSNETLTDKTATDLDASHLRIITQSGPNGGKVAEVILRITASSSYNREMWIWPDDSNGSGDMIYHGMQLENTPNSSSIIEATTSATTRAGDSYSIPLGDWFSANEGTLFLKTTPRFYDYGSVVERIIHDQNGNRILAYGSGSGDPFNVFSDEGSIAVSPVSAYKSHKVAISSNGTDVVLSVEGTSDKDSGGANGYLIQDTKFPWDLGYDDQHIFSKIIYFPRALSESTLNTITTPDAPEITLTDANGINLSAYVRA